MTIYNSAKTKKPATEFRSWGTCYIQF